MSPSFADLVPVLATHGVRFIIIGGVAGVVHGAARATYDIDIVYARDTENIERLVEALQPHRPYLRGAPPGLPFKWDAGTVQAGLNFTLTTDLGPLDLLGEVTGGGFYEELLPSCEELQVFGVTCRVVTLEKLIQFKRAAGRPEGF
jgi:predicted nucleotidyltransferase